MKENTTCNNIRHFKRILDPVIRRVQLEFDT